MQTDNKQIEKKKAFESGLRGEYVLAHINTANTDEGLCLPEHLLKDPTVTLKLSHLFTRPLEITDVFIKTELRFGHDYLACVIPWKNIWGMTTEVGQNIVWPLDAPEDVLTKLQLNTTAEVQAKNKNSSTPEAPPKAPAPSPLKKRDRSHLKRIK